MTDHAETAFLLWGWLTVALLAAVFALAAYLLLRSSRRGRPLTPREEAARRAAVRSFAEAPAFCRRDSVLYLSDVWEVAHVSPSGGLLRLRHTDGRETLVEARLVRRLGPAADRAVA